MIFMKVWDKGYKLNKKIENFTVGEDFILDQKLVKYDCLASIAHVKMLGKVGLLTNKEAQKIVKELNKIIILDKKGKFKIKKEEEDCHTSIENYLIKKLGDLGKKVHTARSRNDQVLAALRLYYRDELDDCKKLCIEFIKSMEILQKKYGKIKFPGYTHTRKAMPSSIGMWSSAFIASMRDNIKLIDISMELIDQSPLGTGAGYGVPLNIDRKYTAKLLGFKKNQENIYVQNSRGKFESTILHAMTQIMLDLNKISTDIILFSMPELGYFEIPQEFTTGSSIMPQKKNPDALELVRARYHVVTGYEFQIKGIISNLISGYNRDLQLTKETTIKGLQITKESLDIMALIIMNLKVNKDRCSKAMTKEIFATEEAYKLVKKGVPFRDAYRKVSEGY